MTELCPYAKKLPYEFGSLFKTGKCNVRGCKNCSIYKKVNGKEKVRFS